VGIATSKRSRDLSRNSNCPDPVRSNGDLGWALERHQRRQRGKNFFESGVKPTLRVLLVRRAQSELAEASSKMSLNSSLSMALS
jgi:hypothetical protein